MSKVNMILGMALVVVCGAFAEPQERSIAVTGTAVVQVVPDYVAWNISIIDTDPTLLTAKQRNDERVAAAMELIKALGTKPVDVQTSNVSVYKEYNHDEQGRQTTFKDYAVNRSISVQQRELNRFDEFFNALVEKTGADVNFSWQSSRATDLRKEARKRAVQLAKEKAEAMLAELGAQTGPVLSVEEEGPRNYAAVAQSNGFFEGSGPAPTDEISGTFAPGAIDIRVSVSVKFGIAE